MTAHYKLQTSKLKIWIIFYMNWVKLQNYTSNKKCWWLPMLKVWLYYHSLQSGLNFPIFISTPSYSSLLQSINFDIPHPHPHPWIIPNNYYCSMVMSKRKFYRILCYTEIKESNSEESVIPGKPRRKSLYKLPWK